MTGNDMTDITDFWGALLKKDRAFLLERFRGVFEKAISGSQKQRAEALHYAGEILGVFPDLWLETTSPAPGEPTIVRKMADIAVLDADPKIGGIALDVLLSVFSQDDEVMAKKIAPDLFAAAEKALSDSALQVAWPSQEIMERRTALLSQAVRADGASTPSRICDLICSYLGPESDEQSIGESAKNISLMARHAPHLRDEALEAARYMVSYVSLFKQGFFPDQLRAGIPSLDVRRQADIFSAGALEIYKALAETDARLLRPEKKNREKGMFFEVAASDPSLYGEEADWAADALFASIVNDLEGTDEVRRDLALQAAKRNHIRTDRERSLRAQEAFAALIDKRGALVNRVFFLDVVKAYMEAEFQETGMKAKENFENLLEKHSSLIDGSMVRYLKKQIKVYKKYDEDFYARHISKAKHVLSEILKKRPKLKGELSCKPVRAIKSWRQGRAAAPSP